MEKKRISYKQIIRGQENLDRMKKEINQVVYTLLGLSQKHIKDVKLPDWTTASEWELSNVNGSLTLIFYAKGIEHFTFDKSEIPLYMVEVIFSHLENFVDFAFEVFPQLLEETKYHRSATEIGF